MGIKAIKMKKSILALVLFLVPFEAFAGYNDGTTAGDKLTCYFPRTTREWVVGRSDVLRIIHYWSDSGHHYTVIHENDNKTVITHSQCEFNFKD